MNAIKLPEGAESGFDRINYDEQIPCPTIGGTYYVLYNGCLYECVAEMMVRFNYIKSQGTLGYYMLCRLAKERNLVYIKIDNDNRNFFDSEEDYESYNPLSGKPQFPVIDFEKLMSNSGYNTYRDCGNISVISWYNDNGFIKPYNKSLVNKFYLDKKGWHIDLKDTDEYGHKLYPTVGDFHKHNKIKVNRFK